MTSEKRQKAKTQTHVDFRGRTSNGCCYHINKEGETAVYCRRGETYKKSKELKKAIHEILDTGRKSNFFIWQWYEVPIFEK